MDPLHDEIYFYFTLFSLLNPYSSLSYANSFYFGCKRGRIFLCENQGTWEEVVRIISHYFKSFFSRGRYYCTLLCTVLFTVEGNEYPVAIPFLGRKNFFFSKSTFSHIYSWKNFCVGLLPFDVQ